MVYTNGIKEGQERDKLDDRGIAPISFIFFIFYPSSIFVMYGVHLREQEVAGSVTNWMTEELLPFDPARHAWYIPTGTRRDQERDKLDDRGTPSVLSRLSCMVYTYGNKEGRERDKLDDTEESPTSKSFSFIPLTIFVMHGVHLRDQGGPCA